MLNLRISGENCLIFNWHSSRAAPGISFLVCQQRITNIVQTGRRKNIVAVITRDTVMKAIQKGKLKTKHFELHYPQENMICHK